jgi:hypothetical protein
MVIHNFDFACFVVVPDKAQSVLFVDSDRVLPGALLRERFEGIARGPKIVQASGLVQLDELSDRRLFDGLESAAVLPMKDPLRFHTPERANHVFILYRYTVNVKSKDIRHTRLKTT